MISDLSYEIIYSDRPSSSWDTLDEAERFASMRGEPCKIWECGYGLNGFQQRMVVEFI